VYVFTNTAYVQLKMQTMNLPDINSVNILQSHPGCCQLSETK